MIGNQNGVTCFSTEGEYHHKEKMEARSPMPGMTERTQGTNLSRTSWKINLNRKKKNPLATKKLKGNSPQSIPGDPSNQRHTISSNLSAGNRSAQTPGVKGKTLHSFSLIYIPMLLEPQETQKNAGAMG